MFAIENCLSDIEINKDLLEKIWEEIERHRLEQIKLVLNIEIEYGGFIDNIIFAANKIVEQLIRNGFISPTELAVEVAKGEVLLDDETYSTIEEIVEDVFPNISKSDVISIIDTAIFTYQAELGLEYVCLKQKDDNEGEVKDKDIVIKLNQETLDVYGVEFRGPDCVVYGVYQMR